MTDTKGQAAPLIILVIATILVCMMVVFNLGKVSLSRVYTQNAADAGALAASSYLASGQNMIADIGETMFFATVGFNGMMAAIIWPTMGKAIAQIADFNLEQAQQMQQAGQLDDNVVKRAKEAALIYAFINAGVDEQKEYPQNLPYPFNTYAGWRKMPTRFSRFLDNDSDSLVGDILGLGYKSGLYSWQRWIKLKYWDEQKGEFATFNKNREGKSLVAITTTPNMHVNYSTGTIPGLTHYYVPFPPFILPLPYAVWPAYLEVHGQRTAGVIVTRAEGSADWGLWKMEIPTMISAGLAQTTGDSSFYSGGNYDCELSESIDLAIADLDLLPAAPEPGDIPNSSPPAEYIWDSPLDIAALQAMVPAPPQSTVLGTKHAQEEIAGQNVEAQIINYSSPLSAEEVIAFYQDTLPESGWEVLTQNFTTATAALSLNWNDELVASIMAYNQDAGSDIYVSFTEIPSGEESGSAGATPAPPSQLWPDIDYDSLVDYGRGI